VTATYRSRSAAACATALLLGTALLTLAGCGSKTSAEANTPEQRKAFSGGPPPPGEGEYIRQQMEKQRAAGVRPPAGAVAAHPAGPPPAAN
jgi:hypothetical protein